MNFTMTTFSSSFFSLSFHTFDTLHLFLPSCLHSVCPSCLSFLHGTVAFLWTSPPVDMSRLHCPPLHSVFFPLSPPPLFGPLPRCSSLLSLKSVTPHCLFILFGTLSSFHLLFITTVTWQGGHISSHVVCLILIKKIQTINKLQ